MPTEVNSTKSCSTPSHDTSQDGAESKRSQGVKRKTWQRKYLLHRFSLGGGGLRCVWGVGGGELTEV